jgi:hypothetical protein
MGGRLGGPTVSKSLDWPFGHPLDRRMTVSSGECGKNCPYTASHYSEEEIHPVAKPTFTTGHPTGTASKAGRKVPSPAMETGKPAAKSDIAAAKKVKRMPAERLRRGNTDEKSARRPAPAGTASRSGAKPPAAAVQIGRVEELTAGASSKRSIAKIVQRPHALKVNRPLVTTMNSSPTPTGAVRPVTK